MATSAKDSQAAGAGDLNGLASAAVRENIVAETREIERDCRVAVRCHENAASMWHYVYYLLGLPTAILAALAGVAAINEHPVWAAGLATGATIFAATNTFLNAGQMMNSHSKKRSEYEQLKNEIRHFRAITLAIHHPERELVRELSRYGKTRDVLNLESPQVSSRAYRKASGHRRPGGRRSRARGLRRPVRVVAGRNQH